MPFFGSLKEVLRKILLGYLYSMLQFLRDEYVPRKILARDGPAQGSCALLRELSRENYKH
ncbi:hypothetical protein NCCP2140_08330 [Pseudoalteromonas sp. NCCP-2140]|nr:hypothetical protein NCCP2140_08330 [Pseudoalteromonas sp. NCCP-2140]